MFSGREDRYFSCLLIVDEMFDMGWEPPAEFL